MDSMKLHGISDAKSGPTADAPICPNCGGAARVRGGSCVSCLLLAGLEQNDEAGSKESFDEVLSGIDLPDRDWILGNYLILEKIGRGGMGVIYRARQRHSKRIVALKRVLSYHGDSAETLERFRREAEAAASLDHPNILPIYEVGEADGLPFFTMKLATGGSLQQAAAGLSSDRRSCVRILAKISRAVAYAHREGVLHRDLKPGNVLLDGVGEPLVSDFGLAKWLDTKSDLTRSLAVFGTPGYIAPEQAAGDRADLTPAADVYSLGAILFDLLTGRPPFLGEHALAVIRQAAEKPAPKLRSVVPAIDRDLETICAKCLERDPHARYRSATDVAEDLESWLEGRSIRARPVSPPVQLWRAARRNPILAGAAVGCAVLLCTSAIWWTRHQLLQARVFEQQRMAHSFAVLPFLNLDTAAPDFEVARTVTAALADELAPLGPGRIEAVSTLPAKWTGIGTAAELRDVVSRLKTRGLLTGTIRKVPTGHRLSLHLAHERGAEPLEHWVFEVESPEQLRRVFATQRIGAALYEKIASDPDAARADSLDPGLADDTTRELITAGRWLIDRGRASVADMDRAIDCLQNAVKRQPRSAAAHAYLAMACLGRDINSPNPELAARALVAAREAVHLAPNDEAANRALRIIYGTNGHYRRGLEQGFASLELTSSTERTFGQIAFFWHMLGRPDKAVVWYGRAKATGNQLADYEALLGDCWLNLGEEIIAEKHYRTSMQLRSDLPEGAVHLSRLLMLRGDLTTARELCERAIRDYPNSPYPPMMLAQIEFFGRNYERAEQLYAALHQATPEGGTKGDFVGAVSFASALARLRLERGDSASADELLSQASEITERLLAEAPQNGPGLYRRAAIAAMRGDKEKAIESLEAAIRNGWIDFRSTRLDPRFDGISREPRFEELLASVERQLAIYRSEMPEAHQ
jgi:tetratricopeptide (TPR) repeat protein/tRNA A-37 threonylcarbamoyl transferase component Bud32